MGNVRAFCEDDIEQIARLHRRVFPPDDGPAPPGAYEVYFRDTFLAGPRPESGFASLVHEEPNGELSGFLGVVPVRMALGGRTLWATVCTQFCVDPDRRGMAGLKLIRSHFSGGQDLSISDGANALTARVWRWAGADAVVSGSLHFVRPLRPSAYALSLVARRPALARVARLSSAPALLLDVALARLPHSQFHQAPPATRAEPLEPEAMIDQLPAMTRERPLAPVYEPASLAWTLRRAREMPGELRAMMVRDERGAALGWYVYQRAGGAVGEVLQIAAPAAAAARVLDHLIHDAWRAGLLALRGRLDPALAQVCSERYCVFSRRGPWMVVHARDPAVLLAFHRGEALFSRLDGEWCARFSPPSAQARSGRSHRCW